MSLKARVRHVLYLVHSSPRDDQEDTFVRTLQSHDRTTLLVDRSTSSHSRPRTNLGYILETEEDRVITQHVKTTVIHGVSVW